MAADIGLWQIVHGTKKQKTEPKRDYISALWSEYKREKSDRVLGHIVGEIAAQSPTEQEQLRRPSLTRMPAMCRNNSIDSSIDSEAAAKASVVVPSPATGDEQPRRKSWWRRSSSSPQDMENFIHMAFAVS
ncbi:hypothetical protein VTO58DRAFT_106421 [Aureobasidium pullulans]